MAHPIPAVIAIVERQGEFLLVRRLNQPDAGLWGHAGGKLEWGESLMQAALRELYEETGVRALADRLLPPLEVIASGTDREHHFVLCPVVCRYRSGEATPGDDVSEVGWFSIQAMQANPDSFSQDVPQVCRQALASS